MDAFAFIECHYDELRTLISRKCSRNKQRFIDDIWDDVILTKVQTSIETFDPSYGRTLKQHVFGNLRWYIQRWHKVRARRREVCETDVAASEYVEPVTASVVSAIDLRDYVQELMDELSDFDRQILRLHFWGEFTNVDIAAMMGVSEGTIRTYIENALTNVYRIIRNRNKSKRRTTV